MISKIWKDPVWSKVISAGILGVVIWGYSLVPDEYWALVSNFAKETYDFPLWGLFLVVLLLVAIVLFFITSKNKGFSIASQDWFDSIAEKLSDCSYSRLYLRSFDHPDEFREEHRANLMKIISLIADKIRSGADIKIVSYAPLSKNKTGYNWVQAELGEGFKVDDYITVIHNQPVSNYTSMYLFDDKSVVYNKRSNGNNTYHIENYSNSIIYTLITNGFDNLDGVKA
jgi:hypothetical protein